MKNETFKVPVAPRPLLGGIGLDYDRDRSSTFQEPGQRFLRRIVLLDIALDHARENLSKSNISSWGNQ
jgi:hypothetical protein